MSKLQPQDYNNHKKITPMYHYVLGTISTIVLIASFVYVFVEKFTFLSLLLLGVSISTLILVALVRQYSSITNFVVDPSLFQIPPENTRY